MRHYYDVYCLLEQPEVQAFIGTEEYKAHKAKRFRSGDNPVIGENEAFLLKDTATRMAYATAYENTRSLYYTGQPGFEVVMERIGKAIEKM